MSATGVALKDGSATITVTADGLTTSAVVNVTPGAAVRLTLTFTATPPAAPPPTTAPVV
jgi:hypothetical protein